MVERKSSTDPRLDEPTALDAGIAPVVALPRRGVPTPVLIGFAVVAAVVLFLFLENRRLAQSDAPPNELAQTFPVTPPPPLYVPGSAPPQQVGQPFLPPQSVAVSASPYRATPVSASSAAPQPIFVPTRGPAMPQMMPPPMFTPSAQQVSSGSALVIDTTVAPEVPAAGTGAGSAQSAGNALTAGTRARSGFLVNRSTTVPQGTLVPAVLETGFDSTGPGFARAIVSRDVRGFDGSRVLIPRGSRLFGEYRSGASAGQGRAMINWSRLVRPDGVSIALGSPAADTAGRGGIKARVNTHFWQRLGSAALQSVVEIGSSLAQRRAQSVIVAVPGSVGSAGGLGLTQPPTPTLTVRPGTSLTVFVARDLDFTGAERSP